MKSTLLIASLILFAGFLTSEAFFLRYQPPSEVPQQSSGITYHQVQRWFDGQILDHFNAQDTRTFSQRYWVSSDSYTPSKGPIFLYICGEYTCPGVPSDRLFPLEVAQLHEGLFVVLEHRFYGLSQPFNDLKLSSLQYLAVEQALEDLAYFITWFKVNGGYQITEDQPWIAIGGSYPGALSAWFRYKYPHLTVGNWAASAVVNSIVDFPNFDLQIYLSTNRSGEQCPRTIQNLTTYFETQLYTTPDNVQKEFQARFGVNATFLSREELLWFIADTFVETVQYGSRETLCQLMTNQSSFDDLVNNTIAWIVASNDPRSYGAYFLSNEAFNPEDADLGRQWTYQYCSQFGWLQTPATDSQYAMRSQMVNLTFFQNFCENVFGAPIWPNTNFNLINMEFGGLNLQATNLVMTNGAEDPWQWASKINSTGDIQAIYIDCPDCGHCVELYTPTDNDAQTLKDARSQIINFINDLLSS